MAESAENYVPQHVAVMMRKQAVRVWLAGTAVAFGWVSLILIAPLAKSSGFAGLSSPLYRFFSFICHQIPERSFHIHDEQFGVCSRCFGVYLGLFLGFAIYPVWRRIDDVEPLPRFWLFLSMIPICIDWSLTIFGIWENTHLSRVITGLILGLACATYIVPALIEITRNLTFRRQMKDRWPTV